MNSELPNCAMDARRRKCELEKFLEKSSYNKKTRKPEKYLCPRMDYYDAAEVGSAAHNCGIIHPRTEIRTLFKLAEAKKRNIRPCKFRGRVPAGITLVLTSPWLSFRGELLARTSLSFRVIFSCQRSAKATHQILDTLSDFFKKIITWFS